MDSVQVSFFPPLRRSELQKQLRSSTLDVPDGQTGTLSGIFRDFGVTCLGDSNPHWFRAIAAAASWDWTEDSGMCTSV